MADANRAAPDFVLLRTLRASLNELVGNYQWRPLALRFASLVIWPLSIMDESSATVASSSDLAVRCPKAFEPNAAPTPASVAVLRKSRRFIWISRVL